MNTFVSIVALTLFTAVAVTLLVTWLKRIAKSHAEPPLARSDDVLPAPSATPLPHELMTTGEGSRLLLRQGHLVAPPPRDSGTERTAP